jgi:Ser/Thr protein kinase RdoA (MazF antagonist)
MAPGTTGLPARGRGRWRGFWRISKTAPEDDETLVQVEGWLRRFHEAVLDFDAGVDAAWREGGLWRPGLVIGHNDAAPYNAVWDDDGLVGFMDWDMSGPLALESDVLWMAFSWVPLHAREVVEAEGFTDFGDRRRRLELFLCE